MSTLVSNIIYKYVTPDRIDVLENLHIRFTQADALNDPFEINPCMHDFREGALEFAKNNHRGRPPTEKEIQELGERAVKDFRDKLYPDYLMLSLSERNNNLLMWSHYAACHSGLVFGFNRFDPFFQGNTPQMTCLLWVEYSKTRFTLPRFENFTPETILPAFLRKSVDWSYEEEKRMFARASAASQVRGDLQGKPIYLFRFPSVCLQEIIFGIYTDAVIKFRVRELLASEWLRHVKLFQAALDENNFDLNILPLKT